MTAPLVDLRSDAVTRPTEQMWEAMRADALAWSQANDPTVEDLETRAAEVTGKQAALLVPSGTMANTLALLCWCQPGDQFVVEDRAHVLTSEDATYARLVGVQARRVYSPRGHLVHTVVAALIGARPMGHATSTAVVWLENTHNMAGGTIASLEQQQAVADTAHEAGARVHLDGARLWNAAVAMEVPVRTLAAPTDSLTLNLNKGLSAPGGALLCGPSEMVARARARLDGLGGYLSQGALLAAAGLVALTTMVDRLVDDHRTARLLADGIRGAGYSVTGPETNIVRVNLPRGMDADEVVAALAAQDVGALAYDSRAVRLVTHRHIADGDVEQAVKAFDAIRQGHAPRVGPERSKSEDTSSVAASAHVPEEARRLAALLGLSLETIPPDDLIPVVDAAAEALAPLRSEELPDLAWHPEGSQ